MIKFDSDKQHVGGFLRVLRFPPSIKADGHDLAEILLNVAFNTINLPKPYLTVEHVRVNEENMNIKQSAIYIYYIRVISL